MSYFSDVAPMLAAQSFNPAFANPWNGISMLPKSENNAGARPSYISSNNLPISMMNAITNAGSAASESQLRAAQAQEAGLNAQFLQQRMNAFPAYVNWLKSMTGNGMGAPMSMGGGTTTPGGGGYSTQAETGSPASGSTSASTTTAGFGPYAQPVVDQLRKEGWTDAAIAGALANGQAEGGFSDQWQKSGGNENSFGHWQFNDKGELPGYLDFVNSAGGNPQDSTMQARYLASRMEELAPGFGQITDPKAATNLIESQFEKPAKQTSRMGQLMLAQNYLAKNEAPGPQLVQADTGTATDAMPDMGVRPPPTPGTLITNGAVPGLISNRAQGTPTPFAQQLVAAGVNPPNAATTNPTFAPNAAAPAAPAPASPQGAPQGPQSVQAPQGAPALPGGIDPMQLARQGAMSELFGFPNVAQPMLQAYYNSPQYLQQKAAATAQGSYPTQVALAQQQARAQTIAKLAENGQTLDANNNIVPIPGYNESKANTAEAVSRAQDIGKVHDIRQGGIQTAWNPQSQKWEIVAQAPRLPEGTSLGQGPNGEPIAVPVPGANPAITAATAAVEQGKAQVQPLQEQNEVLQKEYETNVVEPFNHAQDALEPLTAIQNAMNNYVTGPGAATKLAALKAFQAGASALGIDPNSKLGQEIASGEVITKEGTNLGFTLARSLGSRESQMIVQQAIASNPGLANSPQGNVQLIGLIKQGLQRDIDKRTFVDNWMAQNHTFAGATTAFNNAHPVETYISRAVPYQPKSESDYNALMPGVTYWNPNTNSYKVKPLNAPANQPGQ